MREILSSALLTRVQYLLPEFVLDFGVSGQIIWALNGDEMKASNLENPLKMSHLNGSSTTN
jgi:hypothetical protein